ncbi:MAG TPA: FAD-dependent oxidoreductase [Ktedonobacterales bacterium]|nr:FAD-dependent oxidoreductase [Ktedonobacterales bacterium]
MIQSSNSLRSSHPSSTLGAGRPTLPVAIIGAGPIGLAAAAHLLSRGETPLILEAGDTVGANIAQWRHVRFFSPWKYSLDAASVALLEASGWTAPDPEAYPTGQDLITRYLAPLAATPQIASHLRLGVRVVSVTRQGFDKMKTIGRAEAPFLLHLLTRSEGVEREDIVLAHAVIDASGAWMTPNPLGASGVMASGERDLRDHIAYRIPDVLGADRARYAGRRVLVAGSGHSAFNVLVDLAELARQASATQITWVIRRNGADSQLFGGGATDALPARGALGQRVATLVTAGTLRLAPGFKVTALQQTEAGIVVTGDQENGETQLAPVDELIVATGFRPDLSLLSELRLALDPATESPVALAPLIDPNVHSCGTVPPHGAVELAHPEQDFYLAGMKSYGRAPTFLLLTGYEQVRSIAAALTNDWEAARDVQLMLPETGVCSSSGNATGAGACCGEPTESPSCGEIANVASEQTLARAQAQSFVGVADMNIADITNVAIPDVLQSVAHAGAARAARTGPRRTATSLGVPVRNAEESTAAATTQGRSTSCCE